MRVKLLKSLNITVKTVRCKLVRVSSSISKPETLPVER